MCAPKVKRNWFSDVPAVVVTVVDTQNMLSLLAKCGYVTFSATAYRHHRSTVTHMSWLLFLFSFFWLLMRSHDCPPQHLFIVRSSHIYCRMLLQAKAKRNEHIKICYRIVQRAIAFASLIVLQSRKECVSGSGFLIAASSICPRQSTINWCAPLQALILTTYTRE